MIRLPKTLSIYNTPAEIDDAGVNFSALNLFATWVQDDRLMAKALFAAEVTKDGIYQGSLSPGRWSGAVQLTSEIGDRSPYIRMGGAEPELMLWTRNGGIVSAPHKISDDIMAAQTSLKSELDASFMTQLANAGGKYTKNGSRYQEIFGNEKSAGLYLGYGDDLLRIATGQIDRNSAQDDPDSATIDLDYRNKFADLMRLEVTRNYGPRYPEATRGTIYTGYTVDKAIPAGKTYEVRIDAPGNTRWYPGSMEIDNISITGAPLNAVTITRVYGQTETFGFVLIANRSDSEINITFDVTAQVNYLAEKVAFSTTVENESHVLTGFDPVRLTNKSINSKRALQITVTDSSGDFPFDLADFTVGLDADGYTTIARSEESTIPDGATVLVTYEYASTWSKTYTISESEKTKDEVLMFGQEVDPRSIQFVITGVSGGGVSSIEEYRSTYGPLHVLFNQGVNGTGAQILLTDQAASNDISITFELWARPYGSVFGEYWTVEEILQDLAKRTAYKDIKLHEYDGELGDGEFSNLVFVGIEEEFDPDTIRVENSGSEDVNIELLEAGEIYDDDGALRWGVRVAVTRTMPTGSKIDYAFQVWGQYTSRIDFFYPLPLVCVEAPSTRINQTLRIIDQTIEDAAAKCLQICYTDDGAKYKMMFGPQGEWIVRPYRTDRPVSEFTARNMASISKTVETPMVIDRVEVKGVKTPPYMVPTKNILLHDQGEFEDRLFVPQRTKWTIVTIEFEEPVDPDTITCVTTARHKCHITFDKKAANECIIRAHNDHRNNHERSWICFEIWGTPINQVTYQEDYTYKTEAGAGGKYGYQEASVENELIISKEIADQVGASIVEDSANGEVTLNPDDMPANIAVEPLDTMLGIYEQQGIMSRGIVEEVTFSFEASGDAPELTMSPVVRPFDRFAVGFGDENISEDDDLELDEDTALRDENDDLKGYINLIMG